MVCGIMIIKNYEEISNGILKVENDLDIMQLDIIGMYDQISRTERHIKIAGKAMDYLIGERKMIELIHFCNTGKYQYECGESLFLRKLLWASMPNKRQPLTSRDR